MPEGIPNADDVATHQKTQQGLKHYGGRTEVFISRRRNASENPTGIETLDPFNIKIKITFVATHQKTQQGLKQDNELFRD